MTVQYSFFAEALRPAVHCDDHARVVLSTLWALAAARGSSTFSSSTSHRAWPPLLLVLVLHLARLRTPPRACNTQVDAFGAPVSLPLLGTNIFSDTSPSVSNPVLFV